MIFTYRPTQPEDRMFIVSGWSSSYRMSRDCTTPMAIYAKQKHEEIDCHLKRERVQTLVAEGSVLAGFISFEPRARIVDEYGLVTADFVYYVYVAQPFRRRGVARGLFGAAGIDPSTRFHYACRTLGSWELRDKIPLAHHSPYYARYSPQENERNERDHIGKAARRKGRHRG